MRTTLVIALVGKVGPYDVQADEMLLWLRDRIGGTDDPKVLVKLPDGDSELPVDAATVRVEKMGDGRWALKADVEIPDGVAPAPAILEPISGQALTAEGRRHSFENAPVETA